MFRTSTNNRIAQRELHLKHGLHIVTIPSLEKEVKNFTRFLVLLAFALAMFAVVGCDNADELQDEPAGGSSYGSEGLELCEVTEVRYPTNAQDFSDEGLLYGGRDFLHEHDYILHLGRDLKLKAGTPIHPIGCGKLVLYRKADGYGDLVAVIEHTLKEPITIVNGDGETKTIYKFLSIYGHGSMFDPTGVGPDLYFQVGKIVQPSDVIMYIQTDEDNGDGPEHLHLGIRIQSQAQAQATDPYAWFRGYDNSDGDYKKYYTAPGTFLPALAKHVGYPLDNGVPALNVTHHPIGTLLLDKPNGEYWLVVEDDQILNVTNYKTMPRACSITATTEELDCYRQTTFHKISTVLDATVVKFDGLPEVYRLYPGAGFQATGYQVFLSYESFLSWGYTDSDLNHFPATEKQEMLSALLHEGGVGMMPGALAKGFGESEVSVADQHGTRRPIFDWDVFLDLGYTPSCVYEIEPSTLDVVAGARSNDLITDSEIYECTAGPSSEICTPGSVLPCSCGSMNGNQVCLDDGKSFGACVCEPGPGGGGVSGSGGANQGGEYCEPAGSWIPCDEVCVGGIQTCLADETLGECECPSAGTGGSGGSAGAGGSENSGGSSGTGGASGASGSAGSSVGGAGGTGGSSGSAGSSQGSDLVSITLRYNGPTWTMPYFTYAVGSNDWTSVPGCPPVTAQTAECTFTLPSSTLDSLRWQVALGMNRYWGDTSGLAPAPCIPASELPNHYGTSVIVMGTVSLELDGIPTEFGLCSNGIYNSNYSNQCGESQFPWMNGCLYP